MKYKEGHFLQLSRNIFNDERFLKLTSSAKWLYVVLNELEHRYSGTEEDSFFRSNEDLAKDSGMSLATVKTAKYELIDVGIIITKQIHWVHKETNKKSRKHITAYKLKDATVMSMEEGKEVREAEKAEKKKTKVEI